MLKGFFRFILLVAIAVGCVATIMGTAMGIMQYGDYREAQFDKRFSFLKDELPRFKELAYKSLALKEFAGVGKPNAKLVVLCSQSNDKSVWPLYRRNESIDPMMASLPARWVPSNATEVTTLVILQWSQEQTGIYADGSIGCQEQCDVDIVDLATNTRMASAKFLGGDPPATKRKSTNSEAIFGHGCEAAVLKFLEEVLSKS